MFTPIKNIVGRCRRVATRAFRRQISKGTALYTACRIQTNVYGKRTNFSFDKAENTETVYVYVISV